MSFGTRQIPPLAQKKKTKNHQETDRLNFWKNILVWTIMIKNLAVMEASYTSEGQMEQSEDIC